jgi:exonuclease III
MYANLDVFLNKKDEITLKLNEEKPDIVDLCELKPKNARYVLDQAELNIQGYSVHANINSHGRGVCIYIKNGIKHELVTNLDCSFEDAVWVSIKTDGGQKILVGCIYRSSKESGKMGYI